MNTEKFTDRILEAENLTDELEDPDANWLITWGIGKLDEVLEGIEDEETAGAQVNALMKVMRAMNRLAGSFTNKSAAQIADDIQALDAIISKTFSISHGEINPDYLSMANELKKGNTRQALEFLSGLNRKGGTQTDASA